ncbi:hypothetical protein CPB83DRAFT_861504 [Crepidotus variabilis]|uniref:Uncharacterized protein n=1 Tax=Crepidotus variabilis TaxID=179855 RepID=A0A9P6E841_9AGAR|nr:hypothetical protein CPB83DRAFT_861504 [Crepidotus variabilis]
MPTTRRQTAIAEGKIKPEKNHAIGQKRRSSSAGASTIKKAKPRSKSSKEDVSREPKVHTGEKRRLGHGEEESDAAAHKPASKKAKPGAEQERTRIYESGTIERGHIYFFYRPRVMVEEVHSIDDIKNFHMLLVPRPPDFAISQSNKKGAKKPESFAEGELKVLEQGADAVPASDDATSTRKRYRLVTVGKKKLPDPEGEDSGSTRRKETFWATVTACGENLQELEKGLGEKTYETKTKGTRHEGPARLVARGGYAIVNSEGKTPSQRETHLGYHVSHPPPADLADVQTSLGIFSASSFVLQVKNPLAPATSPQQAHSKPAEYPEWIMNDVFGKPKGRGKHTKGRESYGLRFVSCETPELLDYKGAELLLIAARDGEEGLETSLGEGRGKALTKKQEEEALDTVEHVFNEIGLDLEKFPVESLEGTWI